MEAAWASRVECLYCYLEVPASGLHPATRGICFSVDPSSNPGSRYVNSQLVSLQPIGIYNYVTFIWKICTFCTGQALPSRERFFQVAHENNLPLEGQDRDHITVTPSISLFLYFYFVWHLYVCRVKFNLQINWINNANEMHKNTDVNRDYLIKNAHKLTNV